MWYELHLRMNESQVRDLGKCQCPIEPIRFFQSVREISSPASKLFDESRQQKICFFALGSLTYGSLTSGNRAVTSTRFQVAVVGSREHARTPHLS